MVLSRLTLIKLDVVLDAPLAGRHGEIVMFKFFVII